MKKKLIKACCIYFMGMLFLYGTNTSAQSAQLKYSIMMNGNEIGLMTLQKTYSPNKTQLSLASSAKKRLIISFEIHEIHTEVFQNNVMTAASIFREVNGKTKVDVKMSFEGTNCQIASKGKTSSISFKPVSCSLLNLYFAEPIHIAEAFSDNFQQMLEIENMGNHCYKIALPDGNSNFFYYANGICTKQVINHSFYKVELVLAAN
jgi:uncharacterized protein DUF6134